MTRCERVSVGCLFLLILAVAFGLCLTVCGCQSQYKGGNIHDGVNASIGVKLPTASSTSNTLQLLWLLNGWVFSWEENSCVRLERTSVTHTSFAGIYDSSATNGTALILYPVGTNGCFRVPHEFTNAVPCACGSACQCGNDCQCGSDCKCGR